MLTFLAFPFLLCLPADPDPPPCHTPSPFLSPATRSRPSFGLCLFFPSLAPAFLSPRFISYFSLPLLSPSIRFLLSTCFTLSCSPPGVCPPHRRSLLLLSIVLYPAPAALPVTSVSSPCPFPPWISLFYLRSTLLSVLLFLFSYSFRHSLATSTYPPSQLLPPLLFLLPSPAVVSLRRGQQERPEYDKLTPEGHLGWRSTFLHCF